MQRYMDEVRTWMEEMKPFVSEQEDLAKQLEQLMGELETSDVRHIQTKVEEVYAEVEKRMKRQAVPIGGHTLPTLPYRYDALEPSISAQIMRLHHTKHHQSYVDGLNKAEKMMKRAREMNDYDLLKHWEREAAFHGSGHYLHTIFWNNMMPKGGGKPKGELLRQIESDFGSFAAFQKHFTEAAKSVEGGGWALLVWSPMAGRLEILQAEKHQHLTQWTTVPLLVLDVWEHAYYLQYKNDRGAYIENWWKVVNWEDVARRFEHAKGRK
jgi:Fe-Mn family superoxide dismutase